MDIHFPLATRMPRPRLSRQRAKNEVAALPLPMRRPVRSQDDGGDLAEFSEDSLAIRRPVNRPRLFEHLAESLLASQARADRQRDRKSTRLNSSHLGISY